ncbi:FGGY-family carbohydrate kinase [Demequina aestuarii]|uniref:FGGY-family carbohydrate kinase n=1 Tax=Demequina aestuarii TaxID=327095 RepID=UPI00078499E6|nr:FGGY family carbohydrate kinase [Demequina aestuarii]
MSVLGVDLGTSGVRVGAYSAAGDELKTHAVRLDLHRDGGCVELDPAQIMAAVEEGLAAVTRSSAVLDDAPEALAFSVQGEAVVPIDQQGDALAWAPVSMDRRGVRAASACGAVLGDSRFQEVTGQPLHPMFSIFKIAGSEAAAWTVDGVRYACLDAFVAGQLGAPLCTDMSMAARTGAFDVDRRQWSEDVLNAVPLASGAVVSVDQLPAVVESGTVIGAVSAKAAQRCGLPEGLPIVAGAHDQAASWFGVGGRPGAVSVFAMGSSDCLTFGTEGRPGGVAGTGLATYPLISDAWVTLAGTAAGGWVLEWLAELVGASVEDLFDDLLDGPSPVLVLPYFAGSGTLDNDPHARGVIAGLDLGSGRDQIARALVEAAGLELAAILAALAALDLDTGRLIATGGGAANSAALRARSDAAGAPLAAYLGHASLRGAAMLAAMGIGAIDSPPPPTDLLPAPHPLNNQEWYAERRADYRELYDATRRLTTSRSDKENQS